jgi:hypothetical protein
MSAGGPAGETGTGPDALRRTVLVVGAALLAALVVTALLSLVLGRARPDVWPRIETFVSVKLFVSTFTVVVLLALVANYVVVYRDLPNPFTRSLLLFSVALLLYALASNPLVWILLGFRRGLLGLGIGGFAFLPDLFAAVAVTVLLHQSYR